MAEAEDVNVSDLMKMKVADLKRELKARGLSTAGNKNELIERLQSIGEDGSTVRTSSDSIDENNDAINAAVDGDVIDDPGNHEESELLDEDDVLEDGLDDELSVEGMSEMNDSSGGATTSVNPESLDTSGDLTKTVENSPQTKPATKRKLMGASKKVESTGQPPKKITLNRKTSISIAASEKENQESVDQDKSKSTADSKETNEAESGPPKKVVKLSGFSVKERLELRAQKFGAPSSDVAKREARAIRFGIASSQTSSTVPVASAEILKKRAERFGTAVSPILKKTELEEKLKLRQQRFGTTFSGSNNGLSPQAKATLDEKKRLRAERFKITST